MPKPSGVKKKSEGEQKKKSNVLRQHTKRQATNRMGHGGYPPLLDTSKRHSDAIPLYYLINGDPVYPTKKVKYPDRMPASATRA